MELYIFDFDDTLAITDSRVKVIMKSSGEEILMTSREFAHFPFVPTTMDVDFGDFARADGTLIKSTIEIMQQAILDGVDVHIVTARSVAEPVRLFLEEQTGMSPPITATAGSAGKSPWLYNKLKNTEYDRVVVFEDCEKNIRSLKNTVEDFNNKTNSNVNYSAMCILHDQSMVQKEARWRPEESLLAEDFRAITRNFLRNVW